uniref:Uncharacterized protein n=1 Tax=Tanacetum cinerariifolium TaxID=118510 RepID=A0A699I143_TANCI|nr:hypothetical protein [Tanacetum cinerariifolium]
MTVAITTKDMQKRRNDVKARTTLLLALCDTHKLRFSKYKTAQELWGAILKTFGGNETTKKTKKNQLKQQYGNFKAEGEEYGDKGGGWSRKKTERGTVSVPPIAKVSTVGVPTASGLFLTVSTIFATASVVTPYSRCLRGTSAKDKEEELKMLIDGLDRNNEMITKHLQEYEQFTADLTIGENIELINELVKYQDHHAKILKYQAQQRRHLSKKEQREFYISILKSHSGWKTKHFRGMTLEEIREKFIPIWKQIEDFVPMSSKEESKRFKRKGLRLKHKSAKRMKR